MVKLVDVRRQPSPPVVVELSRAEFSAVIRSLGRVTSTKALEAGVGPAFFDATYRALADAYDEAYGACPQGGPTIVTAESF